MQPFQGELIDVLAAQQSALTDYILSVNAVPIPGAADYSREEMRQMVSGFFALVREGILGESRELREMYFSSVFPGLRDSGTTATMMVGGSAKVLMHVFSELLSRVSEPQRASAQEWLVQFFSDYLGDMAAVWSK